MVPQRDGLGRVLGIGAAVGARQPKVAQLEHAVGADEQVGGLEVAVQHKIVVAEADALKKHFQVRLDLVGRHGDVRLAAHVLGPDDLLQIRLEEVDHERQRALPRRKHLVQSQHIRVFELLHEADLVDG